MPIFAFKLEMNENLDSIDVACIARFGDRWRAVAGTA